MRCQQDDGTTVAWPTDTASYARKAVGKNSRFEQGDPDEPFEQHPRNRRWAVAMRDLIRRTAVAAGATVLVLGASAGAAAASTGAPTSHLYWANAGAGTIVEANLNGTSPHVIASRQGTPHGVAVDASHLYWANKITSTKGMIVEANLDGTGAKVIASRQN